MNRPPIINNNNQKEQNSTTALTFVQIFRTSRRPRLDVHSRYLPSRTGGRRFFSTNQCYYSLMMMIELSILFCNPSVLSTSSRCRKHSITVRSTTLVCFVGKSRYIAPIANGMLPLSAKCLQLITPSLWRHQWLDLSFESSL